MLHLDFMQALLAIACGSAVGFSLALIGGGGSILAVPLLLYVVGVHDPHLAIGTSALAVSLNAFANLIPHARAGHVRWKAAFIFAATGVVGAFIGSTIGKAVNGQRLLVLFAILMIVVALLMLRGRRGGGPDRYPLPHANPRLAGVGLGAGPVEAAALGFDPPVPFAVSYNTAQGLGALVGWWQGAAAGLGTIAVIVLLGPAVTLAARLLRQDLHQPGSRSATADVPQTQRGPVTLPE